MFITMDDFRHRLSTLQSQVDALKAREEQRCIPINDTHFALVLTSSSTETTA